MMGFGGGKFIGLQSIDILVVGGEVFLSRLEKDELEATIFKFHFLSIWIFTLVVFLLTFILFSNVFNSIFFPVIRVLTTPIFSRFDFDFDAIDEEDSPYPEVRASVSNIDDPDMPAMTIRMWFVGLLLCMTSTFVFFLIFSLYILDSSH